MALAILAAAALLQLPTVGDAAISSPASASASAVAPAWQQRLEPLPLRPQWRWGKNLDREAISKAAAAVPSSCWNQAAGWNYEECCLGLSRKQCWQNETLRESFWLDCCTGKAAVEGVYGFGDDGDPERVRPPRTLASPQLSDEVRRCIVEGEGNDELDTEIWKPADAQLFGLHWLEFRTKKEENFCRNTLTTAIKCVAALPSTSVVLDLLWGGGCAATAAYEGLLSRPGRRGAEIFGFEEAPAMILEAAGRSASLGQPLFVTTARTRRDFRHFRKLLLSSTPLRINTTLGGSTKLHSKPGLSYIKPVVIHARLETAGSLARYKENLLDILCRHRPSIDILNMDGPPGFFMMQEWTIVETWCPPKWVFLNNRNLAEHPNSWMFNYLQQHPQMWRLELMGTYMVGTTPWFPHLEVMRARSWAAFRRLT